MYWVFHLLVLPLCAEAGKIITKGQTFTVLAGRNLELPCFVEDLEDYPIVWKRNGEAIFVDEEQLSNDRRYEVHKDEGNTTFIIKAAEPMDSNEFACMITDPEEEIVHKVIVQSLPDVTINPSHATYHVQVGEEKIVLSCKAEGNPLPTVKWERQNGPLPSGMSVSGGKLVINKVDRKHAGVYDCVGKNSVGTHTTSIKIVVNDRGDGVNDVAPWVKTEQKFVPVAKGGDVNLTCSYDGSPAPQAEWIFNGFKMNFSLDRFRNAAQYAVRKTDHTEYSLILREISEDAFGDYVCRASNNLGSAQATIHVSGRPGPPEVILDEYLMSWKVRSQTPILEYKVHVRQVKADEWQQHQSYRASLKDNTGGDMWIHEVDLRKILTPGVKYELQVKARNALGWGSFARDYVTAEMQKETKMTSSSLRNLLTTTIVLVVARLLA